MATKALNPKVTDTYLELVKAFPLRRLKSRREHAQAIKFLMRVHAEHPRPTSEVEDYLHLLGHLIDEYEDNAGLKADLSHMTPGKVIHHLMEAGGLTVAGLAREIGVNQGNLSEMLAGRRQFSKAAISGLSNRFKLSPALFF